MKALAFSGHPSLSKVDADTIKKLPPSIKFIASKGAGYDKVRLLPSACSESTY